MKRNILLFAVSIVAFVAMGLAPSLAQSSPPGGLTIGGGFTVETQLNAGQSSVLWSCTECGLAICVTIGGVAGDVELTLTNLFNFPINNMVSFLPEQVRTLCARDIKMVEMVCISVGAAGTCGYAYRVDQIGPLRVDPSVVRSGNEPPTR